MSIRTKLFVGITVSVGIAVIASAFWHWQSADLTRFACYLVVAVLASSLKVQLPGIDGTMSVNFLFILLGVMELSLPETLAIGCTATLVQSVWQARNRPDPVKILFNVFGHDGECQCALPTLAITGWSRRWDMEQANSVVDRGVGFLSRQHAANLRRHRADGRQVGRKVW